MRRGPEHELDVTAKSEQHSQQPLGGEAFDLAGEEKRHLGRRIADDACRFGLCEMVIADDRRDLARQLVFRNEGLVRS